MTDQADDRAPVPVAPRRQVRRWAHQYPQLAKQVRCSSGFTVIKGGAMRVLDPLPVAKADATRRKRRDPD